MELARKAFSLLARATTLVASTSLCVLVLVLGWQVFGRYVLNASPSWTEPVALSLMSVVALFGAALAVRSETHFSFPTLAHAAPAQIRVILRALSRVIALASGLALAGFGGALMRDSWDVPMAGAPAPEGAAYVGIAFGGVLIALFALERLVLSANEEPR
jgi:TRAP-type C4-dicarboxylate transport system permease small subunit